MILIDSSSILHAAVHATKNEELRSSSGLNTGGIHTFMSSIYKLCSDKSYSEGVICAWDSGIPLFRRQLWRNYKPHKSIEQEDGLVIPNDLLSDTNLNPKPLELADEEFLSIYKYSRDFLCRILPKCGVINIRVKNCEADDIISVITHHLKHLEPITIVTCDGDLDQLCDTNVDKFNNIKKTYTTKEDIQKNLSCYDDEWRKLWLFNKALCGDSSDNIPGFQQVGGVAAMHYARQLFSQYKSNNPFNPMELVRPPRGIELGLIKLQSEFDRFYTNCNLMDLNYLIDNNLPLYNTIKQQICKTHLADMDEDSVKSDLYDLDLMKVSAELTKLLDSNELGNLKVYLKEFIY